MNSLISIIIPVYNRDGILNKTLKNLSTQLYTNWECLVIDDGSTDKTHDVIIQFTLKDERFKYIKRPDSKPKGANACRNIGLENAKGDYVVFFDSDDLMFSEYLQQQLDNLKYSNYSICKSEWVTNTGKMFRGFHGGILESNDRINDYISFKTFWSIHSVMYKSSFLKSNELYFDESLQQSQEYDFHVKVLQTDPNYAILDKTLVKVIASKDSISYSNKNAFAKASSSLRVRSAFLKNRNLKLKYDTCVFLLHDMHRIFMQQTMAKNKRSSIYAAYYYLKAHFSNKEIFKTYFFKHLFPVIIAVFTYNIFNKGYVLLKKSNTFNYS